MIMFSCTMDDVAIEHFDTLAPHSI